jgi:hypothetical protein
MTDDQTDLLAAYSMALSYFGFVALMNLITLELIRGWFEIEFHE